MHTRLCADNNRRRPNVLYIFTDQQFAGALSCAGNPHVKTPAMDSLAAKGMRFAESYTACPVCSPARGSMWTGLYPHEHGVTVNNRAVNAAGESSSIARLMAKAGYDCYYAGKWHVGRGHTLSPEELEQHPFEVLCPANDSKIAKTCSEFLGQKHDNPFFLVASFTNPHDICRWPKDATAGDLKIFTEEPPSLPPNFGIPPDEPQILRTRYIDNFHEEQTKMTEELWRHYLAAYYHYIELVDAQIGEILDALRKAGLEKDTLVVFAGDHGDGMAAHQWLGKCTHYEEAVRVPFIVSLPGTIQTGVVDKSSLIASCQDFYATVLDYAGVPLPQACSGRSVRSLAENGQIDEWRDQVVSEIWVAGPNGAPWAIEGNQWAGFGRMLRTRHYKYVLYNEGEHAEVLIDMDNDRLEMKNLVDDPACWPILLEHRKRLKDWVKKRNDTAFSDIVDKLNAS